MIPHQQLPPPLAKRTATKQCPSCGLAFPAYVLHVSHRVPECRAIRRAQRVNARPPEAPTP
jgi:hypothetical protein